MAIKISAVRATTRLAALTVAATVGLAGHSAFGQEPDSRYFVRVGPALVQLADEASINIGGGPVPGSGIATDDQVTLALEFGRTFAENWSASVTVGVPPTTDVDGAGTLAAYGRLGEITYGPMVVAVQRRFNRGGRVQPYLGGGAAFFHVFDSGDGAIQNIEVDDAFGPMVQAGAYFGIGDRWGAFVDVKHAILKADATASIGAIPVEAEVDLDPVVVFIGLSRRF
jgi:outer membrane protein